ncbi:hypothetical protein CENSYa_0008 [Cenarchaeum symbiosum A]|uniref:Uncharacterized protein n=1 Tax=Cenarchaeum symbiosum (strain A) TaxID=414004 RepID=A0RTJ9_CENSY|nr:hypothetical protein CENSYa_0008 [Cenarchaeum symbiosum A]
MYGCAEASGAGVYVRRRLDGYHADRASAVLIISLGVLLASAGYSWQQDSWLEGGAPSEAAWDSTPFVPGWAQAFGETIPQRMLDEPAATGDFGCDGRHYQYSDEWFTAVLMYQYGEYLGVDPSFVDEHLLAVPGSKIVHSFQQQVGIGSEMNRLDRTMDEIDVRLGKINTSIEQLDQDMAKLDARTDRHDSSIKSLDVKMKLLERDAEKIDAAFGEYGEYDRIFGRYVIRPAFQDDPVDLRRAMALYVQINDTDKERGLLADEQKRIGDEQQGIIEEKDDLNMGSYALTSEQNSLIAEYNLLAAEHDTMNTRYSCIGDTKVQDAHVTKPVAETTAAVQHPRDGAHRIAYEDVPGFADGTIEVPALRQAISMWGAYNAGLEFLITESPDVTIVWEKTIPGDAVGLHGPVHDGKDIVLRVQMGDYGCDGRYYLYSQDKLADTISHGLGHHLGLGHVITEDHLMFGANGVGPVAFDSLGYVVPARVEYDRFLLQEELDAVMGGIDRELVGISISLEGVNSTLNEMRPEYEEMDAEYKRLSRLYSAYPSDIDEDDDIAYRAAMKLRDQLDDMKEEYERLAEDIDGLEDTYDMNVEEQDALNDKHSLLAERHNCINLRET